MPCDPVTFARVGSNAIVIDCDTVPGAATGTPAVTVKVPPPFAEVVATSVEADTARALAKTELGATTRPTSKTETPRIVQRRGQKFFNMA